jgi:hypothetical protein
MGPPATTLLSTTQVAMVYQQLQRHSVAVVDDGGVLCQFVALQRG